MILKYPRVIAAIAIAILFVATAYIASLRTSIADAAASDFSQPCTTADATTTLSHFQAGSGTTTLTCNLGIAHRLVNDTATLHIQVTGTSTGVANPLLRLRPEVSQNGIDWYPMAVSGITGGVDIAATTTPLTSDPYWGLSLKISTSTATGLGGTGTAQRYHYSLQIPVTEPYFRIVFTDPASGGNYGLWAEIYGKLDY